MKALFIGLGGVGQRHLRILKDLKPNASISAVRRQRKLYEISDTLQADKSVDIEKKYNIKSFSSIELALEIEKPDFAIVANPTSLHIETALKLIDHQIPVLLEKPLSNTNDKVDDLIASCRKNNTSVMIGYMMRFHPCAIQLREYIEKKVLGNIYNISIDINSFMPSWHNYEKYNEFYAGKSSLGGGVVLTEIHEIDLLNSIFGYPKQLYVVGGKRSKFDIDVEDNVSVLMEYDFNGCKFAVTLNMSFVQSAPIRNFKIFGENGYIDWNISGNTISLNNFENDFFEEHNFETTPRNTMFKDQMLHFLNSIKNQTVPITSLENIIGGHRLAMKIREQIHDSNPY